MDIVVLVLLALILPPVSVLASQGLGFHFILNIVLTVIGWVPGVIHALYCIVA
jgi:uncharacterized membrane protein YqaE (UPF0057 family)